MASKAEIKSKKKRAPAMDADGYKAMLDEDRMEDPRPVDKEVNANTDDEGNPIATKDSIQVARQISRQMMDDQQEYMLKTAIPARMKAEAKAKAARAKRK